jgi:beta-phosphoglucomutase-like phosphatase (HAD superfamily)
VSPPAPARNAHAARSTFPASRRFFGDRLFTASQVKNGKPAPDLFLFSPPKAMG